MYALSKRNVRRVIWLNVRENRPERRDVNIALSNAMRQWGNLEVADWNDVSTSHSGVFLPDGHHLLPAGGRLMGLLMAQRLDSYWAHRPIAPVPTYGQRMRSRPDVQGYGAPDPSGAGAASARFVARSPLVGVASTKSGLGYWLARRDGVVRPFGDARYRGEAAGLHLNKPIVGIATTLSGNGYWLVAGDGGVFSYGDARFYGSTGAIRLNQPVVDLTPTPTGLGYWLVAADGGIFSYGDARFYGSTGAMALNEPIVGMASQPRGRGYWLVAYDGGIFTFGAAHYLGSGATTPRYWKIVGMAATSDGQGYWQLAANGEVLSYGTATDMGWRPSLRVLFYGLAARRGGGYWLAAQGPPD
ncbi:MAG: hypothetical protein QOI55_98, partial [Actinomycetota bacterium]|nr:hypothetical protein [Actinomycetota bacterium]